MWGCWVSGKEDLKISPATLVMPPAGDKFFSPLGITVIERRLPYYCQVMDLACVGVMAGGGGWNSMGQTRGQQWPRYPVVGIPLPAGGGQCRGLLIPLAPRLFPLVVRDTNAHSVCRVMLSALMAPFKASS